MADKDWTLLIFINGHNDLDDDGALNVNQMEKIGSTNEVNVVVQWASLAQLYSTKRMLIQKDSDFNKITSPVVQDLGRMDMGDPKVLEDFLKWGIKNYPAKHYFAVVWDHGSGWHLVGPSRAVHARDISFDEISGNSISTEQLGAVMRDVATGAGRKIDIYGSDACLMAMGEVASEMASAVDYFVGSEELEPEYGWPFDAVLSDLTSNPSMTPAELSAVLVDRYVKSYDGAEDVTFSAFDMAKFTAFESAVKDLAMGLTSQTKPESAMVLTDVRAAQTFEGDYGDLGDFLALLAKHKGAMLPAIQNVQQALENLVIANRTTKTRERAKGISVWLPSTSGQYSLYSARYKNLNFHQHTGWGKAITAYLK